MIIAKLTKVEGKQAGKTEKGYMARMTDYPKNPTKYTVTNFSEIQIGDLVWVDGHSSFLKTAPVTRVVYANRDHIRFETESSVYEAEAL